MAKFCMTCGKPLKENNKFCSFCGTPIAGRKIEPAKIKPKAKKAYTLNSQKIIKSMAFVSCLFLIASGAVIGLKKMKEGSYKRPFELWAEGFNTQNQLLVNSTFVDECIPESWNNMDVMDDLDDSIHVKVDVLAKDDMDESEMDESLLRTMKRIKADKISYVGVKMTFSDDTEGQRMSKLFLIAIARIDGKWYLTDTAL